VNAGFNSWLAFRLTCGRILEVSRDAVKAGEEQLVSCAAEQGEYFSICTVTLDLASIYLSRVGVIGSVFAAVLTVRTAVMSPAVAALISV
jgi:hypothetical protein